MEIELPYGLEGSDLGLDGSSRHQNASSVTLLRWLIANGVTDEELERIFRATTVLWAACRGQDPSIEFRNCLDTAIVWERG